MTERLLLLILTLTFVSCSTPRRPFRKDVSCSNQAIKYLKNPRNTDKKINHSPALMKSMAKTTEGMQSCYEEFKQRTENDTFNTCLVVGVDEKGRTDFYNFGSQEVELDQEFLNCAGRITKQLNYAAFGKNYILLQSYQFYVDSSF